MRQKRKTILKDRILFRLPIHRRIKVVIELEKMEKREQRRSLDPWSDLNV